MDIREKEKLMEIIELPTEKLKMYENNPRNNLPAVKYVAASIKEFGFKQPIVIDKDYVIVCGHTRLLAAKKLGLHTVPCVMADDLTDEQIKAYRLADNKTAEQSGWDFEKLGIEMKELQNDGFSMDAFGFGIIQEPEPVVQPATPSEYHEELTEHYESQPTQTYSQAEPLSKINDNKEIDIDDYSDEQFDHECPFCGFRYNDLT